MSDERLEKLLSKYHADTCIFRTGHYTGAQDAVPCDCPVAETTEAIRRLLEEKQDAGR